MRIEVIQNFVSPEEINSLNKFVTENIGGFTDGIASRYLNKPGQHLVSRFIEADFPDTAYDIYDRIDRVLGCQTKCDTTPIVVNHTSEGGQLTKHKDVRFVENKALLRCNILTSKPEKGGDLYVEGVHYCLEPGDIYFCLVSEHTHWTTKVEGGIPRTIWQFGFNVDKESWDSGNIKVQI